MSTDGTLVGQKIGNYVVVNLLGCGGMGEVYLAEHPQIGRKVAIKVLSAHLLTTAQLATRFLSEARAVARIDHPNVIDIYDFGTLEDGRPYYVMEVLKGCELRKVLDTRGKMSAAEVLPYLEQICAGLQAAHDRGIVHRDLKPENVFVREREPFSLKLLDFGIAKVLEVEQGSGLTSSGMVMGTPLFIAPEQALGMPERITPRTDLYSLGVMLYWMLTGRPPFQHEATAILLAMHIRDTPPALRELEPSVPPQVAALVERCLSKEPEHRPASATELAQAFAAAIDESVSGPMLPRPAEPLLSSGSHRTAPTVGGLRRVPSVGGHTTFSASAGEVAEPGAEGLDALPRRSPLLWVGLGVGALAVVGGISFTLLRESPPPRVPPERTIPTPAVRPSAPAPVAAAPDAARPAPKRHQIVVRAGDPAVSCRVRLGERELPALSDPCRFQAEAGQRVRLEVNRPGFKPLLEEWQAEADREIAVAVRKADRRLAIAGAPVAAPRVIAGRGGRPPRVVPPTPKVAPKPIAKTVAPPPAKKPDPVPKAKPKKIGEGTMEMDD